MSVKPSEKQFQAQVVELARYSGFLIYHTFDSRRSASGFPDLVLVRPPTVLFAELKTETGRIRPEQQKWLDALEGCESIEVRLWRPSEWEEIERMLKGKPKRREQGRVLGTEEPETRLEESRRGKTGGSRAIDPM